MRPLVRPIRISVVISAYTELRWSCLVAAVRSAQDQTVPPLEVIVVVDHNANLFARVEREIRGVRAVENSQRPGLSGARNSGVQASRGNVVAFLDDDARAAPDWLDRLTAPYASGAVLGVGGAIEPDWQAGPPHWWPPEFNWVVGCTYVGMPDTTSLVRNLIGANMSFRREVLEACGGFSVDIGRVGTMPAGCEETELCIRASRRWPTGCFVYEPSAEVNHSVPVTRSRWAYFLSRCMSEGRSKAIVSRIAGPRDSLSSERSYAFRTLPLGIVRAVVDAVIKRDSAALARAIVIVSGLLITTLGYLLGYLGGVAAREPLGEVISG